MIKYISKMDSGIYKIALEQGVIKVLVASEKDQKKIDQLIADINNGCRSIDGITYMGTDVLWKPFQIAEVLRKYDEPTANEWCAQEFGGMTGLLERVMGFINSQLYGAAGELLQEIETLSYTAKDLPYIVNSVFETKEQADTFLCALREALGEDEDED